MGISLLTKRVIALFLMIAFWNDCSLMAHEAIEGIALNFEDLIDAANTEEEQVEQEKVEEKLKEESFDDALEEPIPNADHHAIDTIKKLIQFFDAQHLTPSDLVVFDVDMVLTMPQNPLFHVATLRQYRDTFEKFLSSFSKEHYDLALMYMILMSPQTPTHPLMVTLVQTLIQGNIPTLYLTAFPTGSFHQMINAAEWRAFSLYSAGFEIRTDHAEGLVYKQFPKYLGSYPKRDGRLLMTNGPQGGVSKGALLVAYLKEKNKRPQRIYMLDDQPRNLDEVIEALETFDPTIQVTCLHYRGAMNSAQDPTAIGFQAVTPQAFEEALKQIKNLVISNKHISSKQ